MKRGACAERHQASLRAQVVPHKVQRVILFGMGWDQYLCSYHSLMEMQQYDESYDSHLCCLCEDSMIEKDLPSFKNKIVTTESTSTNRQKRNRYRGLSSWSS